MRHGPLRWAAAALTLSVGAPLAQAAPPRHAEIDAIHQRARSHDDRNQLDEAIAAYDALLAAEAAHHGEQHAHVERALREQGILYVRQTRFGDALARFARAHEIAALVDGKDSLRAARALLDRHDRDEDVMSRARPDLRILARCGGRLGVDEIGCDRTGRVMATARCLEKE